MAKARKRVADKGENGENLKFIGDYIEKAIDEIETRMRSLPLRARQERRVVKSAIVGLKLTAGAAKLHCGPTWFFLPR
jgi:hypothetical protein